MCRFSLPWRIMVPRQSFINKLREIGYYYKNKQKRTELWRRTGGTHRMFIPLNHLLEDETAASLLRQAGCGEEDIQKFLASAKF